MVDRFELLTEELDHPEGVAWGPDGRLYAGGEAGQIYAVSLDGEVDEVASTGGEILGVALDGSGRVYACDAGNAAVARVDVRSGEVETYSTGTERHPMRLPNALAFDEVGNLYVTDSGAYLQDDGIVFRVSPSGATEVWTRDAPRYPNGCCLDPSGTALYVVESYFPGVVAIPIRGDGSAGRPRVVIELPGTVPDGVALDAEGSLYVTCYRPDRIYVVAPGGDAVVLADDPHAAVLSAPTNVAFAGEGLDRLVVANVGEWHLNYVDVDTPGLPLRYPDLP